MSNVLAEGCCELRFRKLRRNFWRMENEVNCSIRNFADRHVKRRGSCSNVSQKVCMFPALAPINPLIPEQSAKLAASSSRFQRVQFVPLDHRWPERWLACNSSRNWRLSCRYQNRWFENKSWSMWFWRESSPRKTTEVARRKWRPLAGVGGLRDIG